MINTIIKIILGVKISQKNFNWGGIIATIIVLIFGYFIFFVADFFGIIDNLLKSAQQPWYSIYLAKFSFLMIFVKIISLSLFTRKQNTTGRFIAAFTVQFVGFILILVAHLVTDSFEKIITDPEMKTWIAILPYIFSIAVSLIMRAIYAVRDFDVRKFFRVK